MALHGVVCYLPFFEAVPNHLLEENSASQVSKEKVAAALPEENKVYPFERVGCEEWCMDTYWIYPLWS